MSTTLCVVGHLLLTQILLGLIEIKITETFFSYILVTDSWGQDETPYIVQKTPNSALGPAYRVENVTGHSK